MDKISMTYFVDFVLKAGTPKLTGVREFKERKEAEGRKYDVVTIAPEGGRPFEFWIDAETRLITQLVEREAEATRVEHYSDLTRIRAFLACASGHVQNAAEQARCIHPRIPRQFFRQNEPGTRPRIARGVSPLNSSALSLEP